jgi:hypothetical protein
MVMNNSLTVVPEQFGLAVGHGPAVASQIGIVADAA